MVGVILGLMDTGLITGNNERPRLWHAKYKDLTPVIPNSHTWAGQAVLC